MKLLAVIFVSVFVLSGCATPAKMKNMTPSDITLVKQHSYSVGTSVSGGEPTGLMSATKISDEDFKKTLEKAISDNRIFSEVTTINGADYLLEVVIKDLWQPKAGFNMAVTLTTSWKLTDNNSSKVTWEDNISSEYTATMGDAFVGSVRLRLATEGAARQNIKEGIEKISELNLVK